MNLNIIIVWYNEEPNISKLFKHLEYLKSKVDCRIIYVDQESIDNSVDLMKKWGAEVYIHPNKWYADPDKKWVVEELCKNGERCFILDCDEEFNNHLADTICWIMEEDEDGKCYSVLRKTEFLWKNVAEARQLRLFKKESVILTLDVHNYIKPADGVKHIHLKEYIDEIDLKLKWQWVRFLINKNNNYSDKELDKIWNISTFKVILLMIWMPILWFFWRWIVHKNFLRWWTWIIHCTLQAQYQFRIYAKLYEKIRIQKAKKHKRQS
jgi:hypothetical protein